MTHPIHTCNKQVTPRAEYFPSPTTTSGSSLPFRGQIWVPIKYKVVILCGNHRTKKLDPLRHLDAILWLSVLMYQAFWNKGYHRRWLLTLHYTQIHTLSHIYNTQDKLDHSYCCQLITYNDDHLEGSLLKHVEEENQAQKTG